MQSRFYYNFLIPGMTQNVYATNNHPWQMPDIHKISRTEIIQYLIAIIK